MILFRLLTALFADESGRGGHLTAKHSIVYSLNSPNSVGMLRFIAIVSSFALGSICLGVLAFFVCTFSTGATLGGTIVSLARLTAAFALSVLVAYRFALGRASILFVPFVHTLTTVRPIATRYIRSTPKGVYEFYFFAFSTLFGLHFYLPKRCRPSKRCGLLFKQTDPDGRLVRKIKFAPHGLLEHKYCNLKV